MTRSSIKHEQVQLAGQFDWDFIDGEIAPPYDDKGGIRTWFAIGRLPLSFTGEEIFQHEPSGREPLEEAARRQTGTASSREPAGGAMEWAATLSGSRSTARVEALFLPCPRDRAHRQECRQNGDTHAGTVTAPRQHASGPARPGENGGV
jgi:hypothetical protein